MVARTLISRNYAHNGAEPSIRAVTCNTFYGWACLMLRVIKVESQTWHYKFLWDVTGESLLLVKMANLAKNRQRLGKIYLRLQEVLLVKWWSQWKWPIWQVKHPLGRKLTTQWQHQCFFFSFHSLAVAAHHSFFKNHLTAYINHVLTEQ